MRNNPKTNRFSRDSEVPGKILLTPFDVTKFGSEDDPCFGKLYSLSAIECTNCGDIEFCAVAFAQKQHLARAQAEKSQEILLTQVAEMELNKSIKAYINKKLLSGISKTRLVIIAAKKFNKTKAEINKLIT
jgi:hypothetical protein